MTSHYIYNRQIDQYLIEFYSLESQPWQSQAILSSFGETHDSLYEKYPDVEKAMNYLWNRWSDRRMLEAIKQKQEREEQ